MHYDWPEVIGNLRKAQRIWARLSHILGPDGVDDQTLGHLYLSIVKSFLLFGAGNWVVTPCIGQLLEGFQHTVERQIKGEHP